MASGAASARRVALSCSACNNTHGELTLRRSLVQRFWRAGGISPLMSSGITPEDYPKMAYWLFKEEPDHYNYADLEKDRTTLWNGVTNNLARLNLRKVCKGDRVLYYHTGKEKAVVGEMLVIEGAQPDPKDDDPKAVVVMVKAVRRLPHPVSLEQIKKDDSLKDWDLVRLPRLSIVPMTPAQWQRVQTLSSSP